MIPPSLVMAAVAMGIVPGAAMLASARWPYRSPAAAIFLWQALGLSWGLATVGALTGLGAVRAHYGLAGGAFSGAMRALQQAQFKLSVPALLALGKLAFLGAGIALLGLLCWVLLAASMGVLFARRHHRELLTLLAHGDPKVPGALILDHPAAAAYCVPGLRSRIVISAGTLALLDQAELAAVLAHERAHLRARHDLVVLPFTALAQAFPHSGLVRRSHHCVSLLVEMLADDHALRHRQARELATALLRVGVAASGTPSGALAAHSGHEGEMTARINRLLAPAPRLPRPAEALILISAVLIVALPAGLLLLPL